MKKYLQTINILTISQWFTSYLKLWAAHSPQLAIDRVNFFDQGLQDGVTDPLQNIQINCTLCCYFLFFYI